MAIKTLKVLVASEPYITKKIDDICKGKEEIIYNFAAKYDSGVSLPRFYQISLPHSMIGVAIKKGDNLILNCIFENNKIKVKSARKEG